MARQLRRGRDEAVRITTAGSSRQSDIASRQRRYVVSMGIRTACFVAAIAVGPGWPRWVLVAAALLLPYVAVVMANAAESRSDSFELLDGGYDRPQLGPGADPPPDPVGDPGSESADPAQDPEPEPHPHRSG